MAKRAFNDILVEGLAVNCERLPLNESAEKSIATESTDSAIIQVPAGCKYFIKSWTITKGTNVTVNSITIDGEDTGQTDSLSDTVAEYGDLLIANKEIKVEGSNSNASDAETLKIEVQGFKVYY